MAIKRLGAQRFSGLEADVNNLPIDSDLVGAIFNSTDTLKFWIFNGTVWNESAGGGGITGLEPNSTILEYLNNVGTVFEDYTTPISATTPTSPIIQVDVQTDTSGSKVGGTGDIDLAVTIGNNASRILVVTIGMQSTDQVVNSVKLGTTDLTRAVQRTPDGFQLSTEIWYLIDPAIGAETIHVNTTNTATVFYSIGALSLFGAKGIGSTGSNGNDPGTGTVTLDITATGGSAIIDSVSMLQGSAGTANLTQAYNNEPTSTVFQMSQYSLNASDGVNTMDWGATTGARFQTVALEITGGAASQAVDGDINTFWKSDPGVNESITVDMGSDVNMYGLAYYLSTDAGMTETQFQIGTVTTFPPDFADDYSNAAPWTTQAGTTVTVDDVTFPDQCKFNATLGDVNARVTRPIPFTLDNDTWLARFKFTPDVVNGGLWIPFLIGTDTAEGALTTTNVGIFLRGNVAPPRIDLWYNDNGSTNANGTGIPIVTGTTYYIEYVRTSATSLSMTAYTDPTFTTLAPAGAGENPTTFTITALTGLDVLNHGANFTASGGAVTTTLDFEDFQLWNGVTSIPADTFGEVIRTIDVTAMTLDDWNFIRFNGVNAQKLIIQGSSGNSLVMAANELAVQLETDPPLTTLHGQFTINGTNATLALNGGDPTTSVIADPSTNSMTLVSAVEQGNPPTDGMVMWNEVLDANNSVSHSKMKIDGAIKNVRWF